MIGLIAAAAVALHPGDPEACKAMLRLQDAIEEWNASFHQNPAYATDAEFRSSVEKAERAAAQARQAVVIYCRGGEGKAP